MLCAAMLLAAGQTYAQSKATGTMATVNGVAIPKERVEALAQQVSRSGRQVTPDMQTQLRDAGVVVDAQHPLLVYLPCGVGGAPSGIAIGHPADLVSLKADDNALAQIAQQAARQHAGAGLGVDVVDGVELVRAEPEDGHVAAVDAGATDRPASEAWAPPRGAARHCATGPPLPTTGRPLDPRTVDRRLAHHRQSPMVGSAMPQEACSCW